MSDSSLEARVQQLEKRLRLTLALAAMATLGFCAVALTHLVSTHRTQVKLSSADGSSEVTLSPDELVFTRRGERTLAVVAAGTGPGLFARSGETKVGLTPGSLSFLEGDGTRVGLVASGERQNRGLGFSDDQGRVRALLGLTTGGEPVLTLRGVDPEVSSILEVDEQEGQRLFFVRGKGRPAAELANRDDWSGCRALSGGDAEASLTLARDGGSEVVLTNGQGKRLVLAPK